MESNQPPSTTPKLNPRARSLVLKVTLVAVAVAWLSLIAASWADAQEIVPGLINADEEAAATAAVSGSFGGNRAPSGVGNAGAPTSSDDEYNFNWLDPEKKIYVLQNRRYLKANRLMISAMVGTGFSNPYRTTYNVDPRLAYYFSEAWGIEAFYTFTDQSPKTAPSPRLSRLPNTLPVIREIRSQFGRLVTGCLGTPRSTSSTRSSTSTGTSPAAPATSARSSTTRQRGRGSPTTSQNLTSRSIWAPGTCTTFQELPRAARFHERVLQRADLRRYRGQRLVFQLQLRPRRRS